MSSNTRPKYRDSELALALCDPKLMVAPIKSTSSLKLSLSIVADPFPRRAAVIADTPANSPSAIGELSNDKLTAARGSLLFSTIRTVNPLFNVKRSGSPNCITGAGPGCGC